MLVLYLVVMLAVRLVLYLVVMLVLYSAVMLAVQLVLYLVVMLVIPKVYYLADELGRKHRNGEKKRMKVRFMQLNAHRVVTRV